MKTLSYFPSFTVFSFPRSRVGMHISLFLTFTLLYFFTLALTSCDVLNPPSEIEWENNPYDGRNPNAVPEIISIEFLSKSNANDPARIAINTRIASQIRFSKVNQTGDPLTTSYQSVQSEYQMNLSVGNHIIAAQGKALNGNESAVKYQSITVEIGFSAGDERSFPLGNSGESIVMCWVPAGSFQMGSPDNEQDRDGDEDPVHGVTFSEGFWLGKYEVTQKQWEAVMGDNPSYYDGVNRPVENVSWNDIQDFESALDGAFRLPSESEWEYACRAGTTTRFYWGDDGNYNDIDRYAVYSSNDPGGTANVGTKLPNSWGLYDMSGNVWEWCEDWYHSDYTNAPSDGSAWLSPSGSYRVYRGGSWGNYAGICRSAFRDYSGPSGRRRSLGFRLVRSND